jgi:cytochrome c peroxidase
MVVVEFGAMKAFLAFVLSWALGAEAWLGRPPLGLDLYMAVSASNPLTAEKVKLGRRLFFDKRLSRQWDSFLCQLP